MPDYIGNIQVPEIAPSGVFPIVSDYPHGRAWRPEVAIHQFGSGNAIYLSDRRCTIGGHLYHSKWPGSSAAADRRYEVNFARRGDGLQQTQGRDLAVHGYRDVGPQAVAGHETLPQAGTGLFQIVDDLAHGGPFHLHRRPAAGQTNQRRRDVD